MYKKLVIYFISILFVMGIVGCTHQNEETQLPQVQTTNATITHSNTYENDFEIDVTLNINNRNIHHSRYIPENIDELEQVPLYITLPGWEGLYFQGVGTNLVEDFYWIAKDMNPNIIILAPQLDDWGEQSAEDTILLTEYYKENYNISDIYINGLSGGGETLSLVLDKRPDLYSRALLVSSQWDGEYNNVVDARIPLYFFIGENDSYYGSDNFKETYNILYSNYDEQGLTNEEIVTTENNTDDETTGNSNILVVYYSATSKTERVAEIIAENTNADLFEIEPVDPYTDEDLNWTNENSRVTQEYEDETLRDVELVTTSVDNWNDYDTVFIGYPIWWGIAAWPTNNFVIDNDFSNKIVIPFCTSSSSGLGQSAEILKDLAGSGNWQEGQRFQYSTSEDIVTSWLEEIGF